MWCSSLHCSAVQFGLVSTIQLTALHPIERQWGRSLNGATAFRIQKSLSQIFQRVYKLCIKMFIVIIMNIECFRILNVTELFQNQCSIISIFGNTCYSETFKSMTFNILERIVFCVITFSKTCKVP